MVFNSKIVLPGEKLAVQEEFVAGKNAFDSEDGMVYSDSCGKAVFDNAKRDVSVQKNRSVSLMKEGSIVIGRVSLVKESVVVIEVVESFDEKTNEKLIVHMGLASLPVRNVSSSYVKNLSDEFKIGDIVKAKISMITPYAVDLRTNDSRLGIIKGFCGKCRHELHLFGNFLRCLNCGNSETRKTSSEYLLK